VDIARVRTVVLAGGRSQRMGFDKLTALFAGEPLARRVARGLIALDPVFVATPQVAEAVSDLRGVRVIVTAPTAGPSATLALAHAAIEPDAYIAVLACDLPFLDAERVRAFVARVPDDADLAWPVVADVPGHPVMWSPKARVRIDALRDDEPPMRVRSDAALRTCALAELDDAYVLDVDTPEGWARAEDLALRRWPPPP
jgi:CTP:molybdopterin cytidylyltransferase MocA